MQSVAAEIAPLPPPAAKPVDFASDIRPIFEQSCFRCHGAERPKSGFRLVERETAISGGDNGAAIIPGDSTNSPLIHHVARFPSVAPMPPEAKGSPLTLEQISLLRAWIDQGATWDEATVAKVSVVATPMVGFASVTGNAAKFREHYWMRDDLRGGIESFEFSDRRDPESRVTVSGHLLSDDYATELLLEKTDLGFVHAGFTQFRKYYADTGGYVPSFNPSAFDLGRELHLDTGRAWLDLGLTLPDWPRLVLGYEYQYRDGDNATLQWGAVGTRPPIGPAPDARNIYPALKAIDEHTHVLKFDAEFAREGWQFEESFRGEWTDSQTRRSNGRQHILGNPNSLVTDTIAEGWHSFQGANTVRVERNFRDWLQVSAGWLYSHLSADADFSLETLNPTGGPIFPLQRTSWYSQRIVLERESQVANANTLIGPWGGLFLTLGVQAEWTQQSGTADGFYDIIPLSRHEAVNFIADIDKAAVAEHVSLRYTQLPFTTLYVQARLEQENIGHREADLGAVPFERNTDAESTARDFQFGFDSSPRSWFKLGSRYRYFDKEITLDDGFADFPVDPIEGYPTFIQALERTTHEIESRLTLRAGRRCTTTLTHRLLNTDYRTTTESLPTRSPGGAWTAGEYDAQIFSLSTTITPWRRLHCSATISYQDIESISRHDRSEAVVPYRGDTWSLFCNGRYELTPKTDVTAGYTLSTADFRQQHFATGLPLGMDYELHGLQAGLVSRRNEKLTLKLQYGFYHYREPGIGGVNDYDAHAILAAMTLRWP